MTDGLSNFAEIAVPLGVHETFVYAIPEALRDDVRLGSRVEVPVGSRLTTGFVVALVDRAPEGVTQIREIRDVLDGDEPALLPEILELCRWAAGYYLAPIGEMLRVALPASMASRGKRRIEVTGDDAAIRKALDNALIEEGDLAALREAGKRVTSESAFVASVENGKRVLARLRSAGLVSVVEEVRDIKGVRHDRWLVLQAEPDAPLTAKQQAIVDLLREWKGEAPVAALQRRGLSESPVAPLVRKGIVRIEKRHHRHTLDAFLSGIEPVPVEEFSYTEEQSEAIRVVRDSLGRFAPFLLEGVTGSGKTEVYVELMRETVRQGKQALLLVPEIALTPVFAARLRDRFGSRIAILHSALSPSERYDQWWRARHGQVDVAIGPRSALFTPFQNLGLIVVDEEGDGAYKQDETPRYNARDLAVVRARMRGMPVVPGSATPSLESRENAARGRYKLLMLTRRVEARALPRVEIVDIRKEKGEKEDRGLVVFSGRLREELAKVFEAGEQAIILMNRRGYAPFLLCRECESDFRCRDCSVCLTYHRREGLLLCHYCGFRSRVPVRCPLCSGEVLHPIGFGTERVEERFRKYFPEVPVEVLDRDSTRKRGALVAILERFRHGETRALIGTQMLSKGHHFPNVTLTAVISADSILGYPDFRSAEKTFYLLTQVAGRSGRGDIVGRVLVQTGFPNHYAIQHVIEHDYEAFYRDEIEFRRTFHYPPATGMIALLFRSQDLRKAERAAADCARLLEPELQKIKGTRMQGPAPAPLARLRNEYRFQILLRSHNRHALRNAVAQTVRARRWSGVDFVIDVDPIQVL